ncbi:ApeA N-terminal domain 1-containing protein [Mucilaginibacter polytrichastri]|uniref:ApeA N-terminal domain-containing protein n=1 Tax=Mucilaginibacter polytrichastri TaxID=1302689 RepID=A0A1Q6A3A8_9SPHI|nr:hypothetical protein RG47T_3962 [Mucilaginibacter polytrichastri]SFT12064.1 hypothetical protein SAMN04487890_111128 [Mucilaginibacter polytrichastri]
MKEVFEIKGYWFLPNDQDNRVAGTLYFVPNESITLELIGSFHFSEDHLISVFNHDSEPLTIIHGESSDAKPITLINCNSYGSLNFDCSFAMQKFSVQYVLKGLHINSISDDVFAEISVRLPLLTAWVNSYRIEYSIPFKNDRANGFELSYNLDNINLIPVQIDKNLNLELEFTCSPPGTAYEEELIVKQAYQLNIRSKKATSFLKLLQKASRFNIFLSLGTLNTIFYESISL